MARKDVATPEKVVEDRVCAAARSWKNLTEENLRRNMNAVLARAVLAARSAVADCDVAVSDVRASCTPKGVLRVVVEATPRVAVVEVKILELRRA